MPLISLEPELQLQIDPVEAPPAPPVRFTYADLSRMYSPGWGLLYSVVLHEAVFFGLFFLSFTIFGTDLSHRVVEHPFNPNSARQITYLPVLGGGTEGNGLTGGGPGLARKLASPAQARSSTGFTYPGPQPIVSDPPEPTNPSQTLLQPGLVNPPILPQFVPLPNIVQMTNAAPSPIKVRPSEPAPVYEPAPVEPPKVKLPDSAPVELAENNPALPTLRPAPEPPVEAPKLAMPANAPVIPALPAPKTVEPVLKVEKPKPAEAPKPEQVSVAPTRGPDMRGLVSLSPMPAPPQPNLRIPQAEARARFAVSPAANPGSGPDAGSNSQSSSAATGIGNSGTQGSNAAAIVSVGGNGSGGSAGGGGGGVGAGAGKDTGAGKGGSGAGAGRGSVVGPGLGTGEGTTAASGLGAGSGRGNGKFAGITIQGGRLETGAATPRDATPLAPQTSYGMTIVSTSNSGGGLADFGVFSHEKVFTVYLDMRKTVADPTPAWTLQYSVLLDPASGASLSREGVVPPFPALKLLPQFPAGLVQRYLRQLTVVYAIMNTQGKLEQMAVMETPDPQLNQFLLQALNGWTFRPAQVNGQPVPVKVLLGIPLSLPQ